MPVYIEATIPTLPKNPDQRRSPGFLVGVSIRRYV